MALSGAVPSLRRTLAALRGALGFCTRLPVGRDDAAWTAFTRKPAVLPIVGFVAGLLIALPLLAPLPARTAGFLFVCGVVAVTGITHLDGVADCGDAAVVHGDAADRRAVLRDADLGVGGTVAVGLVLLGLWTAGTALATLPARALLVVVAAEVGAKASMAILAAAGTPAHDGLGAALAADARPRAAAVPLLLGLPAALLGWPRIGSTIAAVAGALFGAALVFAWARRTLGGVSGDVLGATNEVARIVALHAGVVAWSSTGVVTWTPW